jgi:hypothetical protein
MADAPKPLAEKPLDKNPKPKRAEEGTNPPPYLGVLLVVAVVVALAIGYGNYRSNTETAVQPAGTTSGR